MGLRNVRLRAWAVEWRSVSRLDGDTRHLIFSPEPGPGSYRLFRTRAECRAYIEQRYGYIRERSDLRREPHGWRIPRAIRVEVVPDGDENGNCSGLTIDSRLATKSATQ